MSCFASKTRHTPVPCLSRHTPVPCLFLKQMKNITVYPENNRENLLKAFRRQSIYLSADCGGRGTCGKCKVRFVSEAPAPVNADYNYFSYDELNDGWRLACRTVLCKPAEIQFNSESEFSLNEGIFCDLPHTE